MMTNMSDTMVPNMSDKLVPNLTEARQLLSCGQLLTEDELHFEEQAR